MAGLAALGVALPGLARSAPDRKPNFIIIFTDDQGYQDLGCFGSPKIDTPQIDKMAAEGMRFTSFYSVAAVCTPSRAGLLTGCYPPRVGNLPVLFPRNNKGLHPEETTIAEMLDKAGYATACVGKWHLGHLPEFLPTSQGFDHYYGIPYSNDMSVDPNMEFAEDTKWREGASRDDLKTRKNRVPLMRDRKVIEYPCDQTTLTRRYTHEALEFINRNKNKPFFLYLAHTMPHVPLFASPEFKGKSDRGLYGDVIEEIDWGTGRIIERLKELGIDDHTLVVYTSDNGPWLGKGKDGGSALPLRGGKFSTWEGGFREPTVMWWPGRIPSGAVCDEVAATIDLLPTLARLSGAGLPERAIDGKDIWPLMSGAKNARSPHKAFCYFKGRSLGAIRSGKWKLREGKLYNLETDIGEKNDVAKEHPEVAGRLKKMMAELHMEITGEARPPGAAGK